MKAIAMVPRVKVSADGDGVVSHAGVGLLREVADLSGLTGGVSTVLADTYKGPWLHDPGRVFTDLAVADGADCVAGIGALGDQEAQHGPVASVSTAWRLIDGRVDAAHLAGVKAARAAAGARRGRPAPPRRAPPRPRLAGRRAGLGRADDSSVSGTCSWTNRDRDAGASASLDQHQAVHELPGAG